MTDSTPESESNSGRSKGQHRLFEPISLVLLSVATVGTAWCSYQAASWGAVAQNATVRADSAGRDAAALQLQNSQLSVLDVVLFSQFVNAHTSSNEALAHFYADRFRGDAKQAFEEWLATRPFENPSAAPHPFVTNHYHPSLLRSAEEAQRETSRQFVAAGEAGRIARSYILVTVVLACALFCGGTAAKFDQPLSRRIILVLGLGAFVFAIVRLLSLPMQL